MMSRHGGIDADDVIVNLATATSYAPLFWDCREKTIKQNDDVPHYTWFLLQFWPCSHTASSVIHYTGRFKVKQMIQT